MFYLFLAILSSSTIAFLFKFAENREMNPYVITSANYLIASVVSFLFIMNQQLFQAFEKENSFLEEWPASFSFFPFFIIKRVSKRMV